MPGAAYQLQLRPTTLDDAAMVADLEALRDPLAPPDPELPGGLSIEVAVSRPTRAHVSLLVANSLTPVAPLIELHRKLE